MVSDDVCWFLFATLAFRWLSLRAFLFFSVHPFFFFRQCPHLSSMHLIEYAWASFAPCNSFFISEVLLSFSSFFSGDQSTLHFFLCLPDSGFDFGTFDSEWDYRS